jgi:hypothetical protein
MNDFMNNEEIKALLKRATEMMLPFYIASLKAKTRPAPTLSEIITEGNKRIDDAVQAVIARHEKEIADIKAKAEKEPACNDQSLGRELAKAAVISMGHHRQQHFNSLAMVRAKGMNQVGPQLSGLHQSQNNFGGRWI